MLCCVVLCCVVMLCYVMLCYVMLCNVVLCYILYYLRNSGKLLKNEPQCWSLLHSVLFYHTQVSDVWCKCTSLH